MIFPWFPLAEARWDDTPWDPTGAGSRTKPQEPAISERGHRYGLDMDYIGYILLYIYIVYIYIHYTHYISIHYISIHYIYIYTLYIYTLYIYIYTWME